MALIFPTAPGTLVALDNDGGSMAPMFTKTVTIDGFDAAGEYLSIINRINISENTNAQFLHTLGGDIYIYTFGDRLGSVNVSGLSFESECGNGGGAIGIERVRQFWRKNRLSAKADPITINIGSRTTLQGYLEGFRADCADPANRIFQFDLSFKIAPDSNSGNDGEAIASNGSDSASSSDMWGTDSASYGDGGFSSEGVQATPSAGSVASSDTPSFVF